MTLPPSATSLRRRSPWRWLPLATLVLAAAEIAVLIALGRWIGFWATVALLLLVAGLGVWLLRHEGTRTLHALRGAQRSGRMPDRNLADGALVLLAGLLLVLPGFLSDVVALVLLLPFTRPLARSWMLAMIARRVVVLPMGGPTGHPTARRAGTGQQPPAGGSAADDIIEGEILP